jgi:hypothetical protein
VIGSVKSRFETMYSYYASQSYSYYYAGVYSRRKAARARDWRPPT